MEHQPTCQCEESGHDHDHSCATTVKSNIAVSTHDQSIVGTYRFELPGSYEEGTRALSERLEAIAASVTELGGLVGHIKAHLSSTEKGCVVSVTDVTSDVRPVIHALCTIEGVAIVFGITPGQLEDILHNLLPHS
jgi:hypothetical protein